MALTTTEEQQTRALIAQNAALLSLASNEATITSKLAATKVSLSDLDAAVSVSDNDLLLIRQGTIDKSVQKSLLTVAPPDASDTVKGIVELATTAETQTGTDAVKAVTPAGASATYAKSASPTFTGVPLAPTAAVGTNTTQLATTAFVIGQASATTPIVDGTAAIGTSTRYARGDHVHPTDTSRAALASPTFTGVPLAPTAAVDTNTTQLATTAFVKSTLGSFATGITPFNAAGTILGADIGKRIQLSGATPYTLTLPLGSSLRQGDAYIFTSVQGAPDVTILPSGTDIFRTGSGILSSLVIKSGETLTISYSGGSWGIISGDAALKYSSGFAYSNASNGYQKLPSGIIHQWGSVTNSATAGNPTAVTLPIAFPTAALHVYQTVLSTSTTVQSAWFDTLTTTNFNSRANTASIVSRYFAIGY